MTASTVLHNFFASTSYLSLIAVAGLITSSIFLFIRRFSKRADDSIPLYTPQTVALGNYKKRWSYDNPNALREAYSKVRTLKRIFTHW
jgi:hypothetical protein